MTQAGSQRSTLLHVTNGSVVVTRLHDLGLPGHVLPWNDVLHACCRSSISSIIPA